VVAGVSMVDNRLTSVREELLAAVVKVKPPAAARSRQLDQIESGRKLWHGQAEESFRELDGRRLANPIAGPHALRDVTIQRIKDLRR